MGLMFQIEMDATSKRTFNTLQNAALLIQMFEQGINKGWIDMGRALVRRGQDSIRKDPKTGRIYDVPKRLRAIVGKRYHQASAPGESPANFTGELAKGLHFVSHYTQLEWGYDADQNYGKFLETGTRKMSPRPMLEKVSNEIAGIAENYMYADIYKILRKRF
jgi:hypothetical protein